ncbi:MAG: sigma-70 family RNA polymerase sigma factor [Muribaculaceae bacterium]|nr:sigma-70 family RNA polymerase sigma factor [Muribaculaceae bacterium]MDE6702526.1 sigma-70 family RNA polymerase sigma factor [Muribaculaceae bacterium]
MHKFDKQTDDQLVASYASGNNEAFDALLQRHQSRVYNYIYQMVREKNLAEDIFQETFVKAITTIRQGRYTENGKFSAWISRIARNLVIDYFRQEKTEAAVSSDDENFDVLNRKELSEETIEDVMIDDQIRADIRRLIRHLPKSQRQVLVMRYYRNLSFKEIAEATGVSINTALGRMRYAILNLRRIANENAIALTR